MNSGNSGNRGSLNSENSGNRVTGNRGTSETREIVSSCNTRRVNIENNIANAKSGKSCSVYNGIILLM